MKIKDTQIKSYLKNESEKNIHAFLREIENCKHPNELRRSLKKFLSEGKLTINQDQGLRNWISEQYDEFLILVESLRNNELNQYGFEDKFFKLKFNFKFTELNKSTFITETYSILETLRKSCGTAVLSKKVDYPKNQLTFISSNLSKKLSSDHKSSINNQLIIFFLKSIGMIKEVIPYVPPKRGLARKVIDHGICTVYWMNTKTYDSLKDHVDMIIPAGKKISNKLYNNITKLDDAHMIQLFTIFNYRVSNRLYKAACNRIKLGASEYSGSDIEIMKSLKEFKDDCIYINKETGVKIGIGYGSALTLRAIKEHDFIYLSNCTIDSYSGRFHTVMTRLQKNIKINLSYGENYDKLVEFDIKSSQPSILANMIQKKDGGKMLKTIEDGNFYETLAKVHEDRTGYKMSRDEAKQWWMLGAYSNKFSECMEEFHEDLKLISLEAAEFVKHIKLRGKGNSKSHLPKILQRKEVKLMFNKILSRIIKENIMVFSTVHDSIVIRDKESKFIDMIVKDEMRKIGMKINISIK